MDAQETSLEKCFPRHLGTNLQPGYLRFSNGRRLEFDDSSLPRIFRSMKQRHAKETFVYHDIMKYFGASIQFTIPYADSLTVRG